MLVATGVCRASHRGGSRFEHPTATYARKPQQRIRVAKRARACCCRLQWGICAAHAVHQKRRVGQYKLLGGHKSSLPVCVTVLVTSSSYRGVSSSGNNSAPDSVLCIMPVKSMECWVEVHKQSTLDGARSARWPLLRSKGGTAHTRTRPPPASPGQAVSCSARYALRDAPVASSLS